MSLSEEEYREMREKQGGALARLGLGELSGAGMRTVVMSYEESVAIDEVLSRTLPAILAEMRERWSSGASLNLMLCFVTSLARALAIVLAEQLPRAVAATWLLSVASTVATNLTAEAMEASRGDAS